MFAPGQNPVVSVEVNGHQFVFRRPTRADVREAYRSFTRKLLVTGLPGSNESDVLNTLDGQRLLWEAKLEIGLMDRRRGTETVAHGEIAPEHWLWVERSDGKEIARRINFDMVTPEEFDAVTKAIEAELLPKD